MDLKQTFTALQKPSPFGLTWFEWAGVTAVGLVLGTVAKAVGLRGALMGSALYVLGYYVRGRRPADGWLQAAPAPAPLPTASQPDVIDAEPPAAAAAPSRPPVPKWVPFY